MLVLTLGWIGLFLVASFIVTKRSRQGLVIKPMLWYLALLLMILFGGLSLVEYLFFGAKGITNRWTLAVLSEENVYLFSSLWFISAASFAVAAILTHVGPMRTTSTWNKFRVWEHRELNIALHIAFALALFSAMHEGHFTLLRGVERTTAMWMRYEHDLESVSLPYKDIFFVYFALLLMWIETQSKRQRNLIKYLHVLFVTVFMAFSVLRGGRLIVVEALVALLIFNLWKGKGVRFKTLVGYGVLAVGASVAFYSFRGALLSLITKGIIPSSVSFGRLSLLQADAGAHMYVTIKAYTEGWRLPLELMPGGSALLGALIGLIPRIINPWKPHTIVYLFNVSFEGLYTGGGFAMNIVADGVFNFGQQFFFVQALLIGSIVGLFDRLRLSRRRFSSTLYVSCASLVIYAVIADLNQFLQVIMWRLITLFVVMTLTEIVGLVSLRSAAVRANAGNRKEVSLNGPA